MRTRIATEDDAAAIVALYEEFSHYLRELGDKTEIRLTSEIYRRDGFGTDPAFYGLVAESENTLTGYRTEYGNKHTRTEKQPSKEHT